MIRRYALLLIALVVCWGCGSIAPPRIFHPGPADYQQNRAQTWDPFPLNDVAPYIGGGRPLQYDIPAPENERAQNMVSYEERYGRAPPPGMYRPPRATPSIVVPAPIAPPF
jgi:hypothetical protein